MAASIDLSQNRVAILCQVEDRGVDIVLEENVAHNFVMELGVDKCKVGQLELSGRLIGTVCGDMVEGCAVASVEAHEPAACAL